MKRYLLIFSAICLTSAGYAQSETKEGSVTNQDQEAVQAHSAQTDSTVHKTTELEELVVKGENAWIENGKAVFIPQKSAKNLAENMESLIERMHTGLLTVNQGEITTVGGKPVKIFINGVPVDDMDRSTFWAKNALRVEYMESSDDPRFGGATNIVNFVMKEYVAGGLTKLNGRQTFPNNGNYTASSKLVFGKMTYNAVFKGGYSRDHFSGNDRTENYGDVWYGGTHYDNIKRLEQAHETNRKNDIYAGINARYTNRKNFVATHNVALQWNENPESLVKGTVSFNPRIIDGNSMLSKTNNRSLSPTISGKYSYFATRKFASFVNWSFSHSHNNSFASYAEGDANPFDNISRENTYDITGSLRLQYMLSPKMALALDASEKYDIFHMAYSGNTVSSQKQKNSSTDLKLSWFYYPSDKVTVYVIPQLGIYDYRVNDDFQNTDCLPGVNADITCQLSRKSNVNFHMYYYQQSPSASMRNDLILRQTELKWIEGNPSLKPKDNYDFSLQYFIMPLSWLSTTLSASTSIATNSSALLYRSGGSAYDGVIGQYLNGLRRYYTDVQWNLELSFFDDQLSLSNSVTYMYSRVKNAGAVGWFRNRTFLTWDFGNCSLRLSYFTPQKWLNDAGTEKIKQAQQYDLSFSYGNGNLILGVELNNIFNKRYYTDRGFESGPYSYTSRSWGNGRNVAVSLTWTFDYGKKVDPSIDISTQEIRSTSGLGTAK